MLRRLLTAWVDAGGFALLLVSVAPFGGSWFWALDALGAFRPQFGAAAAGLLVFALLLRPFRWTRCGVLAAAVALNGLVLWPYLAPEERPESTAGAPELRLLHWNTWRSPSSTSRS